VVRGGKTGGVRLILTTTKRTREGLTFDSLVMRARGSMVWVWPDVVI
jgi:hypothetical protein